MTTSDKRRLCDFLSGSDMPLAPAMVRLGIVEGINITLSEISDTIAPCRTCHRWTDPAVLDKGRCPRCDQSLNPENQQRAE